MERYPVLLGRKNQNSKNGHTFKTDRQINAIPIKIPITLLTELKLNPLDKNLSMHRVV